MISFVLAAVLAQAVDAGPPGVEQLYVGCKADVPLATVVDGGVFVPDERVALLTCRHAACESFANAKLLDPPALEKPSTIIAVVAGGAILTAVAVLVGYLLPHPAPAK